MKVFCRFAPNGSKADRSKFQIQLSEEENPTTLALTDLTTGASIAVGCHDVFSPKDDQRKVYNRVGLPLIEKSLTGESCALLAYGQTASGKTHSMLGAAGGDPAHLVSEYRGIIPRLIQDLYSAGASIEERPHQFKVDLAFFEVYNEIATDLVGKYNAAASAKPGSDADPSVYTFKSTERHRLMRSLKRICCHTAEQCLEVVSALCTLRSVGATNHNLRSSRSHVVLELTPSLVAGDDGTAVKKRDGSGKITLVDLAGSESLKVSPSAAMASHQKVMQRHDIATVCSGESSAVREKQLETKSINTSLFALKKVVHALHNKTDHVPYKDSILTVILQDCLPSPDRTTLLVCCSTAHKDMQETLASLRFGAEASKISPKPLPPVKPQQIGGRSHSDPGPHRGHDDNDLSPTAWGIPRGYQQEEERDGTDKHRHPRDQWHTPADAPTNEDFLHLMADNAALQSRVEELEDELAATRDEMESNAEGARKLMEHCDRLANGYQQMEVELRRLQEENRRLRGHTPSSSKQQQQQQQHRSSHDADASQPTSRSTSAASDAISLVQQEGDEILSRILQSNPSNPTTSSTSPREEQPRREVRTDDGGKRGSNRRPFAEIVNHTSPETLALSPAPSTTPAARRQASSRRQHLHGNDHAVARVGFNEEVVAFGRSPPGHVIRI